MQSLLCIVLVLVSLYLVQGRTYGYQKKIKKAHVVKVKDPIGFPTDQVHIPKEPVLLPSKRLPDCDVGCTLQIIPPECIQETFGFEHGVRCRGCDVDICNRGRGDNLDRLQGGSQWQNGGRTQNLNSRIGGGFVDSLGGGRNQNLNSRIGGGFLDSLGGGRNQNSNSRIGGQFVDSLGGGRNQNLNSRIGGEFVDSLGSDFFNEVQNSNLGGRFRNRQNTNFESRNRLDINSNDRRNRFETNRQVGSGW
ncbi:uncharacterized protein LOC134684984 [Mytilus trossulus]|uniref:uncharacterized protein LOC134684984 n=1 Tax=Mytilus trossulus TaxID=6551 RepID=UPI003006D343